MPEQPRVLEVRQALKRFGSVVAIDNVDIDVAPGEILTLLGPSGSGKSTLLKIVAGFEEADAGVIRLNGRDITSAPPAKRDIGMVFQNYALFPHMSVADNIAFPLRMRHLPKGKVRERVAEVLRMVELENFETRLPRQLSGGQQQRVALARAIVFNPKLLLLDEPFSALDRKLRETMQLEMRRLQHKLRLTTLFVTHDQEEALILSDRIAVMNEGQIAQVGRPRDIYVEPANWFVADFIGESNMLRGTIKETRNGKSWVSVCDNGTIVAASSIGCGKGEEIGLVIRPEQPQHVTTRGGAANQFDAEVTEVIYMGQSHKYRMRLDAGIDMIVRWADAAGNKVYAPGDRLKIGWRPEDVRLIRL